MSDIISITDFLPIHILDSIDNEIKNARWDYGWRSTNEMGFAHWNLNFTKVINENGLPVDDLLPPSLASAWEHISKTHFPNHRLVRCYTNSHTFGVEGYPHKDSNRNGEITAVVYLNKTWKREWGGETMIYDGDTILHAELPKYNKALVFPGNIMHVSRGLTRICPELRISLMFKMTANDSVDLGRDNIQQFLQKVGAENTKHSKGTLSGHLLRTYDLLKAAGKSRDVCMAGAIHSIFGTNIFKQITIPLDKKQEVIDIVGERAVNLAELFSSINRPHALEMAIGTNSRNLLKNGGGSIEVGYADLMDLVAIECANLQDQNSLKTYQELSKCWTLGNNHT